jgi:nitrate/TMAO reductase-like tetraheme cytochrome c subunit
LLWEQNCARCHNYRSPRERSDAEWAIIVHHMRVRGNLTATEHREILHFLQAAN